MKTFAIKDSTVSREKPLAYLLYYEVPRMFFIEIPEETSEWEAPLLLSSFVKRKKYTVDDFWSKKWVQQRIIPPDRQNLGEILRENGLEEYDEFSLLLLAEGRCAQDDCYIEPVEPAEVYERMRERFGRKIRSAIPLPEENVLLFFENESVRKCSLEKKMSEKRQFQPLRNDPAAFARMKVLPGGNGICWGEFLSIPSEELYQMKEQVPLTAADFNIYIEHEVISTAEAAKRLECTRQNIEDLIRRNKLHPVKSMPKSKLFLNSEVERRKWK